MRPVIISRWNNRLLAPDDWNFEKYGPCGNLHVRGTLIDNLPFSTSAWLPSPAELGQLRQGLPLLLTLVGIRQHPPVMLAVGKHSDMLRDNTVLDGIITDVNGKLNK